MKNYFKYGIIFVLIFVLPISVLYYYMSDINDFDDSSFKLPEENMTLKNGYFKIEEAALAFYSLGDIGHNASGFAEPDDLFDDEKWYVYLGIKEDGLKTISENLVKNEQALKLLDEALAYDYHYKKQLLNFEDPLYENNAFIGLYMLLMDKAYFLYRSGDINGSFSYIKKALLYAEIQDQMSLNLIEGLMVAGMKNHNMECLISLLKVKGHLIDDIEKLFPDINEFKLQNYEKSLVGEYLFFKRNLPDVPFGVLPAQSVTTIFFLNIHRTNKVLMEYILKLITFKDKSFDSFDFEMDGLLIDLVSPYSLSIFEVKAKGLYFYKNLYGQYVLAQSIMTLKNFVKSCYQNHKNAAFLETFFAEKKYERKYGKISEKLEDLVPEFLDKMPINPIDGKPIEYSDFFTLLK